MKIFLAVSHLCGVLLFVGLPENILADTEAVFTAHQVRSECDAYPTCQLSCDRPDQRYLVCPRVCRTGNICESGYVRQSNVAESPCILPADCPPHSRIHKVAPKIEDDDDSQ